MALAVDALPPDEGRVPDEPLPYDPPAGNHLQVVKHSPLLIGDVLQPAPTPDELASRVRIDYPDAFMAVEERDDLRLLICVAHDLETFGVFCAGLNAQGKYEAPWGVCCGRLEEGASLRAAYLERAIAWVRSHPGAAIGRQIDAPDTMMIVSSRPAQATMNAMWSVEENDLEHWCRPTAGQPYYQDPVYDVRVVLDCWERVLRLSEAHIATFLTAFALWTSESGSDATQLRDVHVHANDFLAYLGRKRHKYSYRPEDKEEIRQLILDLNNIWLHSVDTLKVREGRRPQYKKVHVQSRLLEVAVETECDLWFERQIPYGFRIRPGAWAAPWVTKGDNFQMALMFRRALEYNPRQGVGRLARRLGILLPIYWRIRASTGNYSLRWRARMLLEKCHVRPDTVDHRLRRRTREYLEDALDQLQSDAIIGSWQWETGDEDTLPDRGWWEPWLEWMAVLTAPTVVSDQYKYVKRNRQRHIRAQKAAGEGNRRGARSG